MYVRVYMLVYLRENTQGEKLGVCWGMRERQKESKYKMIEK